MRNHWSLVLSAQSLSQLHAAIIKRNQAEYTQRESAVWIWYACQLLSMNKTIKLFLFFVKSYRCSNVNPNLKFTVFIYCHSVNSFVAFFTFSVFCSYIDSKNSQFFVWDGITLALTKVRPSGHTELLFSS